MYEKILIPLDGSKVGEAALPYVEDLVSKLSPEVKVEVTLLQVVPPITYYPVSGGEAIGQIPVTYTGEELEQIRETAIDYLDKAIEGLRNKGVTVKTEIRIGKPAEEIKRVADEISVDLIAMSTHGRSGLSRWAFGSITDKVLREGNKPILVVRAPA